MLARSTRDSELRETVRQEAREHRDQLRTAATEAGVPDPEFTADALHLVLRGYYFSSLEDPDVWTTERVTPIVRHLVEMLAGSVETIGTSGLDD